jgi:hypothetical protein
MPITFYLPFVRIGRFAYTKIEKVSYELPKTVYNFPRFLLSTVQHETCVFLYGSCLHGHLIEKHKLAKVKIATSR